MAGWPAEADAIREAAPKILLVGRALLLVRAMDMHHRADMRLAPSLNRAFAIMQGEKKAGRYDVPSVKTLGRVLR